jgi:hypothetical protein
MAGKSLVTPRVLGARSSAVEHLTFNQRVVGSIPTGLTIFTFAFARRAWFVPVGLVSARHGLPFGCGLVKAAS